MNHYKEMQDKLKYVLGPVIMQALSDPSMIELMCNEDGRIWLDTFNGMTEIGIIESSKVMTIICTVAGMTDGIVNRENPDLSAEMPLLLGDDYIIFRFQAMIYPTVLTPIMSIRRPASKVFTWEELEKGGVLTLEQIKYLKEAVKEHKNIIVVGGTASGKTTFVNTILLEIADQFTHERIGILQDTLELQSPNLNKFLLRASEYRTMNDLLKCTLRLRPDRIVIGEVRGSEVLSLLKSWNTGHPGGVASLHSNSAYQGLNRIEQLIQEANVVPVKEVIAQTINVIVHITKSKGNKAGRIVNEILEVQGFDKTLNEYLTVSMFKDEPVINLGKEVIFFMDSNLQ